MNLTYIAQELNKRDVEAEFVFVPAGTAIRFPYDEDGQAMFWYALLPKDDESDARFVDFVESSYLELRGERSIVGQDHAVIKRP